MAKGKSEDLREGLDAPAPEIAVETAQAPEEARCVRTKAQGTVIYVGPNIPGGALQRFQVFKGGLPPYVEKVVEKIPEAGGLIVPVSELETIRRKIETPGSNEARLFYAVQRAAKGVR